MSELKVYKVYTTRNEGAFGFCEGADPTDIELEHESVCLKSDVDRLLDEKDAEIASLKAQIAEAKELSIELQKRNNAIADNAIRNVESYKSMRDAEIESLKASHYAERVGAGMRERRLRRALYKACANWAMSKSLLSYSQAVKFESYLPTKGAKLRRRSSLWHHCYEQCEAMAEEYK